jgi:2-aminoadipate transaminase
VHASPNFTQNALRPGFVEFAFGEPDPTLLPVELIGTVARHAIETYGAGAISYGRPEGPAVLREEIARRVAAREGCVAAANCVMITGGNSQGLDLALTVFTRPGDVVLVESPTYNLALGIMRDRGVETVAVPLDDDGLEVGALEALLSGLRSAGRRVRMLYTIPTFHNPTGVSLALGRRRRLLALAADRDLIVVEDDVYRELAYDGEAPPSLWSLAPEAPVVRLGSFSKSLAPGLRVGWVNARPDLLSRLVAAGVLESGGCVSQYAATVAARVLAEGAYDAHIIGLRRAYASRRDALAAALREHLPSGCHFAVPAGGFFLWLSLPAGLTASRLLPFAERCGVAFAPGVRFSCDGDDRRLRLAFCLYDEAALAEGALRLASAIRTAESGCD